MPDVLRLLPALMVASLSCVGTNTNDLENDVADLPDHVSVREVWSDPPEVEAPCSDIAPNFDKTPVQSTAQPGAQCFPCKGDGDCLGGLRCLGLDPTSNIGFACRPADGSTVLCDIDCQMPGSLQCEVDGACYAGPPGKGCIARTDADCAVAPACTGLGYCTVVDGLCAIASSTDCAKSRTCKLDGNCSLPPGSFWTECGKNWNSPPMGFSSCCFPQSGADCEQSCACRAEKRCIFIAGDSPACGYQTACGVRNERLKDGTCEGTVGCVRRDVRCSCGCVECADGYCVGGVLCDDSASCFDH
jgi:hypothetical protein